MAEINGIATGKGKKSTKRIEVTSVGEDDERIIKIEGFEKKIKKALFTEIIDRTKDNWEIYFERFKEYYAKEGSPYISRVRGENRDLGLWCSWQRTNKDKGTLSSDRIHRLTEAGFSWAPSDEKWERRFNEYIQFTKLSGKKYFTESDRSEYPQFDKLFYWCRMQKILYNRNSKKYSSDRYSRLTQYGFNFQIDSDEDQTKWLEMFDKLKAFKLKYNHCNVSQTSTDQELKKLGKWLNTQRTMYKGRISSDGKFIKMPPDRVKLLEGEGVIWNAKEADWEKGFEELKMFKIENGHFNIPQTDKLYYRARRLRLKKETLSSDQLARLNSIGFYENYKIEKGQKQFKPYPETNFNKRFNQFLEFKAKFGTIEIKARHKEFSGLYYCFDSKF